MCGFCGESDDTDITDLSSDSLDDSWDDPSGNPDELRRVLTPLEVEYIEHCRETIGRLTGEKFIAGPTPWLVLRGEGTLQMMSDGYCEKFNLDIEYMGGEWDFSEDDILHTAFSAGIPIHTAIAEMKKFIVMTRTEAALAAGIWRIYIPSPDDLPRVLGTMYSGVVEMTLKEAAEEYLRRRLHQLTAYLPFIGGPKCSCVSLRDGNVACMSIRQMSRLERYPDMTYVPPAVNKPPRDLSRHPRPGDSILELLKNGIS